MRKSTLKRLSPKKRPRKARANTRGATAADTVLRALTGDALATKAAIERSGGVYHAFVRRLSAFSDEALSKTLKEHERHATLLLELDEKVGEVAQKLKARGFVSPYLKTFVVARSNPLRFMREPPELVDLLKTIRGKVDRFNVDRIKPEDITVSGGGAPDDE